MALTLADIQNYLIVISSVWQIITKGRQYFYLIKTDSHLFLRYIITVFSLLFFIILNNS